MKQSTNHLTAQETERLCREYIDCQLSMLEEAELEYVLRMTDFESPIINDVKTIMGISKAVRFPVSTNQPQRHKTKIRRLAAAASIAVLLVGGVAVMKKSLHNDSTECIAYSAGRQVSTEKARQIAEADVQRMAQFIKTVASQRADEEAKVEKFIKTIQR